MAEEKKGEELQDDQSVRDRESQIAAGLIGVLLVIGAFLTYNYFQKSKETTTEPQIAETIEEEVLGEINEETTETEEEVETAEEEGEVVVKEAEEEKVEVVVTETPEEKEETSEEIAVEVIETTEEETIAAEEIKEGTYVVKDGDCCLWEIAKKLYNNPYEWTKIDEANSLARNSLGRPIISVGDTLNLPTQIEVAKEKAEEELPTTYTVKHGDNLWKIAESLYGDGFAWTKIWDANNLHRLPDGTVLIHAGNVLAIPK